MARKRIAELLQEEVQKPTAQADENVIEVKAEPVVEVGSTILQPIDEKPKKIAGDDLETTVEELTSALKITKQKESSLNQEKLDLESKVLILQANLEEAEKIQESLRQKNKDLETTVKKLTDILDKTQQSEEHLREQNDTLIHELTDQKTLVERISKELFDAKKAAFNLAETNTALTQELNAVKLEKEQQQEIELAKQKEHEKEKDKYKPVPYRKSYRTPTPIAKLPPRPTASNSDENSSQMWLLD